MKFSNFFIPTSRDNPSDAKLISHKLMLRSGMIRQETSGIYTWLPLGYKVLNKIIRIVEKAHAEANINQILMPTIQNAEIWKISNRFNSYGKEMLRIIDRNSKELLYGPTNEEMITSIGKQYIKSYKDLPLFLYHIQSKFRDEIRPRHGVMRAREFLMKDAYSFDLGINEAKLTYFKFYELYMEIFKKIGLSVFPVRAPSGEIGGDLSHEFHLIVPGGESSIYVNETLSDEKKKLDFGLLENINSYTDDYYEKVSPLPNMKKKTSIELGHIFLFGTKYSKTFNFDVDTNKGKIYPFMGSYGIGISRIPAAIIEAFNDEKGILWPREVVPFDFSIINLMTENTETTELCDSIYNKYIKEFDILYDERNERPGIKFTDHDLMGIPIHLIVGKNLVNSKEVSIKERQTGKEINLNIESLHKYLKGYKNDKIF
ncbi:MAG: proline--tRNA ligase [Rickettsiales bacterium]|nr:proline--tRNA ligase [Rickettsiales bacterium]